MQFFWLWIDDFVGKGLDAFTILKFIWYQSAVLIPLALPLAVLLSSLMTFGNLGETFELVAIKSSGISLLRFMRPLVFVSLFISFCAFLFANYVIPVAQLKSRTMLTDIVRAKPAFDIKEGIFYDKLNRFAIKIGKKEKDDSTIRDVIVFENSYGGLQDNFVVAKNGVMKPSPDKHFLDIVFKDGWRYQERGSRSDSATEYIRLGFKEYKMQLDISSFNFKSSSDSSNRENEKVLSMRQLTKSIDSMEKFSNAEIERYRAGMLGNFPLLMYRDSVVKAVPIPDSILNFKKNLDFFMGRDTVTGRAKTTVTTTPVINPDSTKRKDSVKLAAKVRQDSLRAARRKKRGIKTDSLAMKKDSVAIAVAAPPVDSVKKIAKDTAKKPVKDSAAKAKDLAKLAERKRDANTITAFLPDSAQANITDRAIGSISVVKDNANMNLTSIVEQQKTIRRYQNEWHKKLVLALACFLMFMIGAPLGSIIRKGGLGMPMIFAIIFFLVFYFSSTTGEKMSREGSLTPFVGMWLSTFILAPIGAFLTYKAMHDSNLFNKEFYNRMRRKLGGKIEAWKGSRAARKKNKTI